MRRRKLRKHPAPHRKRGGAVTTRVVRTVEVEVRTVDQLTRRVWDRLHELGLGYDDLKNRLGVENPSRIINAERVSERAFAALDRALEHPDWAAPLPPAPDPAAVIAGRLTGLRRIFDEASKNDLAKTRRRAK